MAFGMLTTKWQILKKPLQVNLKNAGVVFMTCARLHNYVINERMAATAAGDDNQDFDDLSPTDGGSWTCAGGRGNHHGEEQGNHSLPFVASDVSTAQLRGNSIMRDILVDRIADMALVRPRYNIDRNKKRKR